MPRQALKAKGLNASPSAHMTRPWVWGLGFLGFRVYDQGSDFRVQESYLMKRAVGVWYRALIISNHLRLRSESMLTGHPSSTLN